MRIWTGKKDPQGGIFGESSENLDPDWERAVGGPSGVLQFYPDSDGPTFLPWHQVLCVDFASTDEAQKFFSTGVSR